MENLSTQHYVNRLKEISVLNKYFTWYLKLCDKGQTRCSTRYTAKSLLGYVEQHHILPKSLGGDNEASNLVFLSAREHFIAHLLLVKFLSGNQRYKMLFALKRLMTDGKHTSRQYEFLKKDFQEAYRSLQPLIWKTRKRGNQNYSPEIKKRMSDAQKKKCKEYPQTQESKEKQRQWMLKNNPFRGKKHSKESKAKMSAAIRPVLFCSTCNMNVSHTNFKRFHQHKELLYTDGSKKYSTVSEMARAHNILTATMSYRVKSTHPNMLHYQKL